MAYVQADTQRQAFLTKLLQVHFREQRIEQLAQEKERLQYERQRRPTAPTPGPSDSASRPVTDNDECNADTSTAASGAASVGGKGRIARRRRRRQCGRGVTAEGSEAGSSSAASERTDATPAGHVRCCRLGRKQTGKRCDSSSLSDASSATTFHSGSSAFPAAPALEDLRNGCRPACYPKTCACEARTGRLYELAKRAKPRPLAFGTGRAGPPTPPSPADGDASGCTGPGCSTDIL